jgi:hypothetical protein
MLCGGGGLALLALSMTLACRSPFPIEVRMYDYNSSKVLELKISDLSRFGPNKGCLDFQARNGEAFKGSWLKTESAAQDDYDSGDVFSSIPRVNHNPLREKWSWLADIGFDFDNPPSECILLIANGDQGTILDGIAFFNGWILEPDGIVGVARDNRGHRYRIIGQTSIL